MTNRRNLLTMMAGASAAASTALVPQAAQSSADPFGRAATLARTEEVVDTLRTKHICNGWRFDAEGAERVLRYMRKGDWADDDNADDEFKFILRWLCKHNQNLDYVFTGRVGGFIAMAASTSQVANPDQHKILELEEKLHEAWGIAATNEVDRLCEEMANLQARSFETLAAKARVAHMSGGIQQSICDDLEALVNPMPRFK